MSHNDELGGGFIRCSCTCLYASCIDWKQAYICTAFLRFVKASYSYCRKPEWAWVEGLKPNIWPTFSGKDIWICRTIITTHVIFSHTHFRWPLNLALSTQLTLLPSSNCSSKTRRPVCRSSCSWYLLYAFFWWQLLKKNGPVSEQCRPHNSESAIDLLPWKCDKMLTVLFGLAMKSFQNCWFIYLCQCMVWSLTLALFQRRSSLSYSTTQIWIRRMASSPRKRCRLTWLAPFSVPVSLWVQTDRSVWSIKPGTHCGVSLMFLERTTKFRHFCCFELVWTLLRA